ncbi:MAG TPA: serine/threonine-protein kinase [Ktedonobacteraceae bacterium]|nr:serine/threonine-protein kinase [Ktedonobacteraceae bacterium]
MSIASVDQLVGSILGNYSVGRLLARTKLNVVYEAQQHPQNRKTLLTVFLVPDEFSRQAQRRFLSRFMQECAVLVKLRHPGIVPFEDFGEHAGSPYFVTPFTQAGSLARGLEKRGRFTPEKTLEVLKQVAPALDYAHSQGVLHGSLSPAMILLDEKQIVQIAGFGFVRLLALRGIEAHNHPSAHLLSIAGTFLGSPAYVAPECVNASAVDARADIYSLGITLFELLSGKPPFTGSDPLEVAMQHVAQPVPSLLTVNPEVPEALDRVIQQAVERNPAKRFQSAEEFVHAFEGALSTTQGEAQRPVLSNNSPAPNAQITLPPTVNWFNEETTLSGKWQLVPPIKTGKLPAIAASPSQTNATPTEQTTGSTIDDSDSIDPFAWWATTSLARIEALQPTTSTKGLPTGPGGSRPSARLQSLLKSQRRVVAVWRKLITRRTSH